MGENGAESEFFDLCGARSGDGEICGLPRQDGRCGSWRAGRPPDLPARKKAEAGCLLLRMRPSGPYIAGQRPPTPQSPERLRSTPFDCVAIAPCCFAERKAVLSHAFAALTALNGTQAQPRGKLTALNLSVQSKTIIEKIERSTFTRDQTSGCLPSGSFPHCHAGRHDSNRPQRLPVRINTTSGSQEICCTIQEFKFLKLSV